MKTTQLRLNIPAKIIRGAPYGYTERKRKEEDERAPHLTADLAECVFFSDSGEMLPLNVHDGRYEAFAQVVTGVIYVDVFDEESEGYGSDEEAPIAIIEIDILALLRSVIPEIVNN